MNFHEMAVEHLKQGRRLLKKAEKAETCSQSERLREEASVEFEAFEALHHAYIEGINRWSYPYFSRSYPSMYGGMTSSHASGTVMDVKMSDSSDIKTTNGPKDYWGQEIVTS